ncbi:MAG: hypothetical protein E6I93_05590 [Chloroflexi bacterium]|nr:MAG: hypothetical protein E6I93_05590 [Chloroflexota bacterium]
MLWKLPNIKIAPDVIIPLFPDGSGITNTLLCTWIAIIALVALFYFGTRRRDLIPRGVQNLVEWAVELLLNLVESVAGKANAKRFFPLVATFFIFILFANLPRCRRHILNHLRASSCSGIIPTKSFPGCGLLLPTSILISQWR